MIKLNQTSSENVTVLEEAQLGEVVGGYKGCYRKWRKYNHCWEKRNYDYGCNKDYGYGNDSYEKDYDYDSYDSYENDYDYDYDYDRKCS